MGMDASGDTNVGVVEKFITGSEFDVLLREQVRGRVAEVVGADVPEPGPSRGSCCCSVSTPLPATRSDTPRPQGAPAQFDRPDTGT